ncbi:uncharacterized protein LOC116261568 isoform X2 [Nymphaea colorata]|uniref:uncharacterized protein LOC116261568 isoform X2 n=1 Tax=Nymphaea colorata TaxID=210225 RepID=UPI00214F3C66|nr:uncharacterized protein LOC116261568 isoform X2 [Nymphaea colorata]
MPQTVSSCTHEHPLNLRFLPSLVVKMTSVTLAGFVYALATTGAAPAILMYTLMWEVTKLLAKTASMHLLFGHFGLSDAMYALLFGTVDHENISNIVRAPVRLLVKNGGQKINFCDLPPGFCVGVHKHLRSEFASLLMEHMTRMVGATATTTT